MVGKLIADRFIGKEIIKRYLLKGWRPLGSFSLKVLGENMFLIDFEHSWDKSRVLEGRPWAFEGNLFFVKEFDGLTPPVKIEFEKADFWLRMFNLPLACMGNVVGSQIGSMVGQVEEVDMDEEGIGWGEFLHI